MSPVLSISDDSPLPLLPKFRSKDIERKVFTHRSVFAFPSRGVFEDRVDHPCPDNERFEHLGDSVLGLVITELLWEMYPGLRVGPSAKARSLIVENRNLADISRRYELIRLLSVDPMQALAIRHSTAIHADVFEAYVGGLYADQGLDVVKRWLKALFRPYAIAAYNKIRAQHGIPAVTSATTEGIVRPDVLIPAPKLPPGEGYLALFNQKISQKSLTLEWTFSSLERHLNRATDDVSATMNGDDTQGTFVLDTHVAVEGAAMTKVWIAQAMVNGECYGEGKGVTKKSAKNEAARFGLERLGIRA